MTVSRANIYQTWPTSEAGQVLNLLDFDEETAEQNPPDMSHKSQIVSSNPSISDRIGLNALLT